MSKKKADEKINKEKPNEEVTSCNKTGVNQAIQALDNMYNATMKKEHDDLEQTIANQKARIADLEERLDKAADFCVSTQEENDQLMEDIEKLNQENSHYKEVIKEMADERKAYEKERMANYANEERQEELACEEDKMIREYLEELLTEKEELLHRVDYLSDEIKSSAPKKTSPYSMWGNK